MFCFLKYTIFCIVFLVSCNFSSSEKSTPYPQGEALYKRNCGQCHMDDGSGLGANIPPLKGSEYMTTRRSEVPCIIKKGLKGPITVAGKNYNQEMPPSIVPLNDIEMANILNYLNHRWGDGTTFIQTKEINQQLESCSQ